jgi:hypothetical protein
MAAVPGDYALLVPSLCSRGHVPKPFMAATARSRASTLRRHNGFHGGRSQVPVRLSAEGAVPDLPGRF